MELADLGFDEWFGAQAEALLEPGQALARVTAVDRGAFLIRTQEGEASAELAGRFRFSADAAVDWPCVGDWVTVQGLATGGATVIHGVLPRKTSLRRKRPGKSVDFQLIAANIDVALLVQACGFDLNFARLDRYLVMANEGGMEPWVILTKADLLVSEQLNQIVEQVRQTCGAERVLAFSNTTGVGLDAFRALLAPRKTYCLLGSSGVGKTTLVNRLMGREAGATKPVSATGEGVHTTSRRQLLVLDGGALLVDTPGMRELGILDADEGLDDTFAEIRERAADCRFANCTHTNEPGCAVLQALAEGTVNEGRYQSYLKLKKEAEFHDLSYAEKRRKDRSFGRMVRSVQRSMKA